MNDTTSFTFDPTLPWSLSPGGLPALVLVALVLVGLTVWTYLGVARATPRRVAALIALRLLALLVALLIVLRPAVASRDERKTPSTLLVALDLSESMTTQDEYSGLSRHEALRRYLDDAEPHLQRLREEFNVTAVFYRFGEEVGEYDPQGKPDGKRTDFGEMLNTLFEKHGKEPHLRGLLVLSDGADNGTRYPPLGLAARWRSIRCPIHTFGLGQETTAPNQRDVIVMNLNPDPSPVPVKGKLTVKGILDAPGLVRPEVTVRLLFDDKEIMAKKERLEKPAGNEVIFVTDAPPEPGEIKVTLKVDPIKGETSLSNNELSTYVTVLKEGVSVLYVEGKVRAFEPKFIRYALSTDPRIRLYEAIRSTDEPTPHDADLFQFEKQHYDVILIGDVSAKRLSGGNRRVLEKLRELVDRGAGLLMFGGYESFAGSDWRGTPLEPILPVMLDEQDQEMQPMRMTPTKEGLNHFLLRLAESETANRGLWHALPPLEGMSRLGTVKKGATVFATTPDGKTPILVGQQVGGRVLAFAGDTTWQWANNSENKKLHHRFWQQVVLWLAQQDKAEGSVRVVPDVRRLPAGGKLGFSIDLRGPGGTKAVEAQFDVKVLNPAGVEMTVPTAREQRDERGAFLKTDQAGEYQIVATGWGKSADGGPVGTKEQPLTMTRPVRFLVYQDDAERLRPAADHDFLTKLANTGGGKFHRAEDLAPFLQQLASQPLPQGQTKAKVWPDWRRSPTSGGAGEQLNSLVGSGILLSFGLFVTVLATEWLLRRWWGLV